jgi:hypothetical protein
LAKSNRAYKSAKRSKELLRQKKREEKRKRRLEKDKMPGEGGGEIIPGEGTEGGEMPESQTPESETPGSQ